jgi:prepilin-type N-terminal cleavage/methylation domain-containing protein
MKNKFTHRGYTLIELIVAVGLFALIMTLVSGAYIMMIGLTERAQNTATGIDNLSFALETMTRTIRTGTDYGGGGSSFSLKNASGESVSYLLSVSSSDCGTGANGCLVQVVNGVRSTLTDPSVNITALTFTLSSPQPYVTITVSGTVSGKTAQSFQIKTGAVQRKINLQI